MYNEEIQMYLDEMNDNINKAINHFTDELLQIRAGRANPKIVERVMVDYYGTMTPVSQMATITVPEARMVLVNVWDISALKTVSKAIEAANLGVNPSDDGRVIRLVFPQLTEERRKELVKDVRKLCEVVKVSCRNERRDCLDALKNMKKNSSITEDDYSRLEKDVQKMLDTAITKIDDLANKKEKDIMSV